MFGRLESAKAQEANARKMRAKRSMWCRWACGDGGLGWRAKRFFDLTLKREYSVHTMNATTSAIYDQVLRGLAEEWKHIETLDRGFTQLTHDVRGVERHVYRDAPPPSWERGWNRVENILGEIHTHITQTRRLLSQADTAIAMGTPLAEWGVIMGLEQELAGLLKELRGASAPHVDATHQLEWDASWTELESYFATMQAHAKAVQVKLELRKRFGEQHAAELTGRVMSHLPDDLRSEEGIQAYQQAVAELQEEKQHFKGFVDVVKSLLLYFEGPEERAQRKRSQ